MDRNPESPWNPRVPVDIIPAEFEQLVLTWLRKFATAEKLLFEADHLGAAKGAGGEYKIDVLVRLTVFGEAGVVVLVECKHQGRPVEREDVMVLEAKLRDVGAHKGMLFSTSGFQKGALQYATARGIATITVISGSWLYETKALNLKPAKPPPWVRFDKYAGIRMTSANHGISSHTIELDRIDALQIWFSEST